MDRQSFSLACDGWEIAPEKCAVASSLCASDVIMCLIRKSIQMHIFVGESVTIIW